MARSASRTGGVQYVVRAAERDAQTGPHPGVFLHRATEPARDHRRRAQLLSRGRRRRQVQQHRELVASEAGDDVVATGGRREGAGDRP